MTAKKVSLSLPDDLREWWYSLPDQERAKTVQEILRRSKSFKAWKAKQEKAPCQPK